ncbi:hypothetical protein SAMN04489761_1751 [Tenacibaculum sp. MAR_2009_124]|uniref:hypothetical protein n=1 Tax=Tenacibaculum sp. MAR_2009_124 TaxID=1250059 RepID=UPI00089A7CDE|nr:hypothetical protein [Tenacibaculum sp. MAR_2009_124]SEB78180.1 hypothetical protein SAMN04489761_1751 [Tenacibaculum sp. MAR_2009_124]
MKTKLILLLSIFCISINSNAQGRAVPFTNGVFNNNFENFAMIKVKSRNNGEHSVKSQGTYYFSKEWNKCKVQTIDNKTFNFKECNYNVYDKRMEIFIDNEVILLKKNSIKSITFQQKIFKPTDIDLPIDNKYYQLLFSNQKLKLVKFYYLKKNSVASKQSLGLYHQTVSAKSSRYLIQNGKLIKLPSSKSKILKLLGKEDQKRKFRKYNVKKDEDLIEILKS